MNNSGDLIPKIAVLPGSLHAEQKACGKPICRCARGAPHGPYWYLRWREDGRLRRRYVRPADLGRVRAALAEWGRLHPPAQRLRCELADLQRLLRALEIGEI